MARRGNLVLLAIAIVMALVTSLVVVRELRIQTQRAAVGRVPMESVLVVAKSVPGHSKIDATDVRLTQVPATAIEAGAVTDPSQVVGQYTATSWVQGQQVLSGMFQSSQQASFVSSIPSGEVAYTFADSPLIGVDNLIEPGNYIDIQNFNQGKFTTLTHILVLFVDQIQAAASPGQQATTGSGNDNITVAVTLQQAETLTKMLSAGQIHLLLTNAS